MNSVNEISEGWLNVTLGEILASANTGLDAIKRAPIVVEETGVKCFRIQDASQKKAYEDWGNTKVEDRNFKKFQLVKGDILIARTGNSIGVHYLVKSDLKSVFNNGLIRLRVNEKANYEFLYKIIESNYFNRYVQSIAYGTSTQPNMQINVLLGLELLLPPIEEQKAIAKILTAFDNKIENLKAQNKTLEKTAHTIFKEWFGNYQLGDAIPEGWRVGKLGDVIEIFDSQRIPLSKSQREEKKGEFRYYGATSIMDYLDEYLFDGIYLLLAEDGSVMDDEGYPFLQYVWGKFWVNNHAHILTGKYGFSTEILYLFCMQMRVAGIVTGAVQLKINQKNLLGFELVIPPEQTLSNLDELIQPFFQKLRLNSDQIQSLKKTRETLLPKLMSGQLRVNEFKS